MNLTRQFGRYSFLIVLSTLLALLVPVATQTTAQVVQGATMTVLSGQVAVIRTSGAAIQPAPSGTEVFPGDEIRTLSNSGALITFFAGTEIELGNESILVVQSVSRPGDRVDVSLRQVAGTSISRVHTIIDAGGGYRVEAGGAVALVRGSELGVLGPRDGIVVFINYESSVPIIVNNCFISPGVGVWFRVEQDGRGNWRPTSDCHEFRADLSGGPWNALEEAFTLAQQDEQGDTKKKPAGQVPGGQVQEIRNELDKKKDDDSNNTTTTTTSQPGTTATTQSTTTTTTQPTTTTTTQPTTTTSTKSTTTAPTTVTVSQGATVTTTRTTSGTVTETTTGSTSTVKSTVTGTQTTTVPHTSTVVTTTTVPTTSTSTVTVLAPTTTTTVIPQTETETSTTSTTTTSTVRSTSVTTSTTTITSSDTSSTTTSTTTTTTETIPATTTSTTTIPATTTSTTTFPSTTILRASTTTSVTTTVVDSARLTTTSFTTTVITTTTTTTTVF